MEATDTHDHELWESVATAALDRVRQRQATMIADHDLRGDVQYQWSMDDGIISWSRGGREFLRGRLTVIGSVDHTQGTWLWSWANDSLPAVAVGDIEAVRRYGAEHAFPLLVWRSFDAEQKPVAQARVVALDVLDAQGMWFQPGDEIDLHFAVHDLRAV